MQPQATRWLRLPQQFEVAALQADLARLRSASWLAHYNNQAHQGDWLCLPLRSAGGRTDDIFAASGSDFQDTPWLADSPYFRFVLDSFACDKIAVRLMSLAPGARILPHRDAGGSFEDGVARLHIPIQTTPQVLFEIDGESVHFGVGQTWYMNANCLHAVRNDSAQERIHFVLDCVPNPWLRALFEDAGWCPNPPPLFDDPSIHLGNVQQVLQNLDADPSPAAQQLAAKLRGKLLTMEQR